MDVQITPDHQAQRVASNNMNLAIIGENFTQACSERAIGFGAEGFISFLAHRFGLGLRVFH